MTVRSLRRRAARLPIRWRLALTSAGLTFVLLLLFAAVVGAFTAGRLRSDFDSDLRATAADLSTRIPVSLSVFGEPEIGASDVVDAVVDVAATGDATMRIVEPSGRVVAPPRATPDLGPPSSDVREVGGYRVVSRPLLAPGSPTPAAFLQYGREEDSLNATVARVNFFLGLGVLVGTGLALLAGLAVARRAMRPIAGLTWAAREVAGTGDPRARIPVPSGNDEVADLARTLEQMLGSLDAARRETEATLAREREFVADASHELRTPLTSVLVNLELLEAELEGEERETAGAALRSTKRMRRLVGDLLFLARADAGRPAAALQPIDVRKVLREVVAETAPLARTHELSVDAPERVVVDGSPDDLHRLALNLVQNAVVHTPPGTRITASARIERGKAGGSAAVLEVADDGPGVPAAFRERVFERFVRGAGDGGGHAAASIDPAAGARGSGLGLAIVQAVAEAHGGEVTLYDALGGGALFRVRLPLAGVQTSTTTGSTSGLRLSRS